MNASIASGNISVSHVDPAVPSDEAQHADGDQVEPQEAQDPPVARLPHGWFQRDAAGHGRRQPLEEPENLGHLCLSASP